MDNTMIRVPYVEFSKFERLVEIDRVAAMPEWPGPSVMEMLSHWIDATNQTWELVGTTPQGAQYVASSYDVLAAAIDDQARLERHEQWRRELDVRARGVGRGGCTFVVRQAGIPETPYQETFRNVPAIWDEVTPPLSYHTPSKEALR